MMSRYLSLFVLLPLAAQAQRVPHIGYVYPAGGQQGTTFTVTLGGQSLEGVSDAFFSGSGLRAVVLRHDRQVTPTEQKELAEKLAALREKRQKTGLTPEEEKLTSAIRQKLTGFGRQLVNRSLNEFVTLQVNIATNAAPGKREIRLGMPVGLSNPLVFCVGQMREFSKPDWKNIPKARESMDPERSPVPNELRVTLPVTINGQIQPGGVDRFRFAAKQGQRLTFIVNARELIPFLADASPGSVQPSVTLFDAQGKELTWTDENHLHADPVYFFQVSKDGEYQLEVRDTLYRGREDFVYRISVGELPFTLNTLPRGNVTTNVQTVTLPIVVNGCIARPKDQHMFRFEGRAGERVVAEVMAHRFDSLLDSILVLSDAAGKRIAFNDDSEDKDTGLNMRHPDSYLAVTLPANGAYFVHLTDAHQKGGPNHTYRLRLSAPQPDFALRVTPSSVNIRAGASAALTVYALRRDGFSGPISLALKDPPKGFALAAAEVPANHDQVKITLTAPPMPTTAPLTLHIQGRAAGIVRSAVPADNVTQAFAYRHLVPAQELKVAVCGRAVPRAPARIVSATPVKIPSGGTVRIEVNVSAPPMAGNIVFALDDAPVGIALKEFTTKTIVIEAEAGKVKPGLVGNLIVEAFIQRTDTDVPENKRRVPLGAMPAIPFEIVKP
jgi:hypothetical protein